MTQTISSNAASELAARLLYLSQQKALIEKEVTSLKEALEELYEQDGIAAKSDCDVLYSDGSFHKVRLQRKKTGTYFKVQSEFKEEFSGEKHKLEQKYLKAGKAQMAEKSPTWVAQEVKG